jgi:hypothetical protein
MDERVAIALGSRGEEEGGLLGLGEAERIMGAVGADLESGDGVLEVIDRAGWRGEMEDVMDVIREEDEVRDIVLDELVVIIAGEVLDIGGGAGQEIIDADDAEALLEEAVGKV